MRFARILIAVTFVIPCALAQSAADAPARELSAPARELWLHFDAPLWDLADEGLPFRLTVSLPSRRGPLTRLLGATEARWTGSIGYAKVYNSFDAATGTFKNAGGHAALFSAGRQFRWRLSNWIGQWAPDAALEFGANAATRPFPADGTRTNLKLITGFEWTWSASDRRSNWSAGVMWPHFSNANLHSRNAGYDGLVVRVGRTMRF